MKGGINMIKIGFVDSWLDNWHAKLYPDFLREAAKKYSIDAEITLAWAQMDLHGGEVTTDAWCKLHNIKRADSLEQLIEETDAIFVLSPDDSRTHEELADLPLKSGKPVYVDKTFAKDVETAKRMFEVAQKHRTPVFSCSAQRYCESILKFLEENSEKSLAYCSTTGPGGISMYSVHQFEMMNALMGNGFLRLKAFSAGDVSYCILDYGQGRFATFTQSPKSDFNLVVSDGTNGCTLECKDYYINFMKVVLEFYLSKMPPVTYSSTMEIMSMIDTLKAALKNQDIWVEAIR
jgi:hypothetical protein